MDDKRIQQVLDIEKQALAIREEAVQEAEQLPLQAEKDAQQLLEQSRAQAQAEAREMIAKAKSAEETSQIMAKSEETVQRLERVASRNVDRAVNFVVNRVVGRE